MGSTSDELREANCDMGTISRSDGSALFCLGDTCAIAAVHGPCVINHKKYSIDEAVVDVSYRPLVGQPGINEKMIEATLTKISEIAIIRTQYPRAVISISVQEMQNCGGLLSCCINALCLALINSGLPMKFVFAAVTCIIDENNEIIMDPDNKKLKNKKACFTLTMENKGNIISSEISGKYTPEQLTTAIAKCQIGAAQIHQFYREAVKKYSDRIAL